MEYHLKLFINEIFYIYNVGLLFYTHGTTNEQFITDFQFVKPILNIIPILRTMVLFFYTVLDDTSDYPKPRVFQDSLQAVFFNLFDILAVR